MDQLMIRVSQHPLISLLTLGTVLGVIWLELLAQASENVMVGGSTVGNCPYPDRRYLRKGFCVH